MKAAGFVLTAAVLAAGSASAADTAGFAFLRIPVGARAAAMGGAFCAVPGDPTSLYWNPASAVSVSSQTITTHYTGYFLDMQGGFAGWVNPGENDAIGVSANYFYGGSFDRTTMEDPLGTGEQFSSSSVALAATYARSLTPTINVGATGKFVYSSIDEYSGNAFLVDAGATWRPSVGSPVTAALVVRNAGIQTKAFYRENDPTPTEIAAGCSYAMANPQILVSAEASYPVNGDPNAALGIEYAAMEMLTLRLGGNLRDMDASEEAGGGFVDGMAFGMGTSFDRLALDYCFKPFADLGSVHRISLGYTL